MTMSQWPNVQWWVVDQMRRHWIDWSMSASYRLPSTLCDCTNRSNTLNTDRSELSWRKRERKKERNVSCSLRPKNTNYVVLCSATIILFCAQLFFSSKYGINAAQRHFVTTGHNSSHVPLCLAVTVSSNKSDIIKLGLHHYIHIPASLMTYANSTLKLKLD